MSRPGQKPLEGLIAAIAGLAAIYPDKTVNSSAELMNGCLSAMLEQIMGPREAAELFDAAIASVSPVLESQFGVKVVSMAALEKEAVTETGDLLARLRKGGP